MPNIPPSNDCAHTFLVRNPQRKNTGPTTAHDLDLTGKPTGQQHDLRLSVRPSAGRGGCYGTFDAYCFELFLGLPICRSHTFVRREGIVLAVPPRRDIAVFRVVFEIAIILGGIVVARRVNADVSTHLQYI